MAFEMSMLIYNWTNNLTLFTNGLAKISVTQQERLQKHKDTIIENEIAENEHHKSQLHYIFFIDGSGIPIKIIYSPSHFEQHCKIPENLGCELTYEGFLKIDSSCETSVNCVYAIGDNASKNENSCQCSINENNHGNICKQKNDNGRILTKWLKNVEIKRQRKVIFQNFSSLPTSCKVVVVKPCLHYAFLELIHKDHIIYN